MNDRNDTIAMAIRDSHTQNKMIDIAYTQDLACALSHECETSVNSGSVLEYWGTTSDGHGWGIRLDRGMAS